MKVNELTSLCVATYYEIVDATKPGYFTSPVVLIKADINVVNERYGDKEVVKIEPKTKQTLTIYAK